MAKRPSQLIKGFAALLLVAMLSACVGSRGEPFAPELRKSYMLTEDLVLTSRSVSPPGFFQDSRQAPFVMTHSEHQFFKGAFGDTLPLPNTGEILEGSRAQVTQMFTYSDLNGRTRYGKLHLTDPVTKKQLKVYASWEDIAPKLKLGC